MTYQWHVFLASLDPITGSEQAGRRPVLVISRERINQLLPVVNVIPLTSSLGNLTIPNLVYLISGTNNINVAGVNDTFTFSGTIANVGGLTKTVPARRRAKRR